MSEQSPIADLSRDIATAPSGVLPVLQLPYQEDETVDLGTLMQEIDWLFERGANG